LEDNEILNPTPYFIYFHRFKFVCYEGIRDRAFSVLVVIGKWPGSEHIG
jgi:hypothetical protein